MEGISIGNETISAFLHYYIDANSPIDCRLHKRCPSANPMRVLKCT